MVHPIEQEQERERTVMRIFEAAVEHTSNANSGDDAMVISNPSNGHASSSSLDLVRHTRSIVDEIPPTGIDEDYVLRLQSQLAIALCTIERQADQLHQDQMSPTTTAPAPRPVLSARQLAESASRRQRRVRHQNSELGEALTMAASLSIDLERTRERMSDAISVTRSRSNSTRSLSLMDALDLDNDVVEEINVDLVAGPLISSLNDIELNDVVEQDGVLTRSSTGRSTTRAGSGLASQGQVEEMLTSIATLEFDLFQTREQLADERSFNKSSGSLQALIEQQDTDDLGNYDIVDTTQEEEQQEPPQADTNSGASAQTPSTATTTSTPNTNGSTNSQVDSNVSTITNTTRVPKTDNIVQGTRMHPSLLRRRSYTNSSA